MSTKNFDFFEKFFANIEAKRLKHIDAVFNHILIDISALYKSSFAFKLFSLRDYLGGCLLPLGGFVLGGVASLILQLRCSQIKTISLEVGKLILQSNSSESIYE